jgi:signal peptidase I
VPNKPNKPNKWIAALLGFLFPSIGMMYVARLGWAAGYFVLALVVAVMAAFSSVGKPFTAFLPLLATALCAVHAYQLAKRYPEERPRPVYSRWPGLVAASAGFVVAALGFRAFGFEPFRAPSMSMAPTIPTGAGLVVQKWGYGHYGVFGLSLFRAPISSALERGDIIAFEYPPGRSDTFVKRLIGLPGDKIAYRQNRLFVNGEAVPLQREEDDDEEESMRFGAQFSESLPAGKYRVLFDRESRPVSRPQHRFPFLERCAYDPEGISCEVPAGHFYVLGDNRDNSSDSRHWGFVPADHVIGKVVFIGAPSTP